VGVCLIFGFITLQSLWLFAQVAIGLGAVIFVHELGHFLVAKACGVKCEKFYVGFDVPIRIGPIRLPRAIFKFQYGETEYGVGSIPLGGYVKMLGQDDNPANAEKEAARIKVRSDGSDPSDQGEGTDTSADSGLDDPDAALDEAVAGGAPGESIKGEELALDPRSYPAKSVPQRMAIISAGVIMNVIFAVIFAMVAYRMGVQNTPCVVGMTVPGSPAWVAGLEPADRIIRIGREGRISDNLRFRQDLVTKLIMDSDQDEVELLVRRADEEFEIVLQPRTITVGGEERRTIGIVSASSTTLGDTRPFLEQTPAALAAGFQPSDKIVALIGEAGKRIPITSQFDLNRELVEHSTDQLTFVVERVEEGGADTAMREVEVQVGPNPMMRCGLVMEMGPITAVRFGSAAEQAGFEQGDVIVEYDGNPAGDPITLPLRLQKLAGESVEVKVQRGDGTETLTVTPQVPASQATRFTWDSPLGCDEIGVAYMVMNTVAAVEAGAAESGIQPGDSIRQVEFVPVDESGVKIEGERFGRIEPIPFADQHNWLVAFGRSQSSLPGTRIKIDYQRGSETRSATLDRYASTEWTVPDRGMLFTSHEETHQADSWANAFHLGLRETKEGLWMVVKVLQKVTTGGISVTNLGGPGMIVAAAGSEASHGLARLLIFLTLLSANLAVINFLPIPVLDGGHMMFLAAEGIRGKPVDEQLQFRLTMVGLAFILSLMVFVIGLDIYRLGPWG